MELDNLPRIAMGGQAEIYDLGDGTILRLMYRSQDATTAEYEFKVLKSISRAGLCIPRVFELVEAAGRPGIVMEKIQGPTMMSMFQRRPGRLFAYIRELADLHTALNNMRAPEGILNMKTRIAGMVQNAALLSPELKAFVLDVLSELEDGDRLCHWDFHPGNILMRGNNPYIIDWCNATAGPAVADAAHTLLLFKNTPRVPGQPWFAHWSLRIAAGLSAHAYLKRYGSKIPVDAHELSRWLLVRAAERLFRGQPSEKPMLVRFIQKCHAEYTGKIGPFNW
jgi:tRNA A-37 threonylcarbamoyl transferase component Bud32